MQNKFETINYKFNEMKTIYDNWVPSWKDIRDYVAISSGKFEDDNVDDGSLPDYKELLNVSAQLYRRIFVSGMLSGMTSPARQWFKLDLDNKDFKPSKAVEVWLEDCSDVIRNIFSKTNLYNVLGTFYDELATFSTACFYIEKDYENILNFTKFTIGEYMLAQNDKGKFNQFARRFSMTVSQLVEKFGIENVSNNVKNLYETNKKQQNIFVRHLICENNNIDFRYMTNKNKIFTSYYWEEGANEEKFLRESGYDKFPIFATRWETTCSSDVYGKNSPGWIAIGDIRTLQRIEKDKYYGLEKNVNPPTIGDADIEEINTHPGGHTVYNPTNPNAIGLKILDNVGVDIVGIENSIRVLEQRIASLYYADLFMMLTQMNDVSKTATEVRVRMEEKMLALAPALERINNDVLNPLIDYVFELVLEEGLVPPPPEELEGENIEIEYISTIAQAQKMIGTQAIEQVMAFIGNLYAVNPEVLDLFNFDEAVNQYATKTGISQKIIRSDEEVAEIRRLREMQKQQLQLQQNMMNTIEGAKVLADTPIRENTALTELMGE